MNRRLLALALLAFCAILALAACGGGGGSSSSASTEEAQGGETETAAETNGGGGGSEGEANTEPKSIGVVTQVAAEITSRGEKAFERAADDLGWEVTFSRPEGDPQKAVTGMTGFVTQGVDAIFTAPWEPSALRQPLDAAEEKGIPVAAVWGQTPESPAEVGFYATPDAAFGKALTEQLEKAMPEGGEVAAMTSSGFYFGQQRDAELEKGIGSNPSFEIVATHDLDYANATADATKAMTDILNAHPNLGGIWLDSSNMLPPVVTVLKEKDLCGKVAVVAPYDDLANQKAVREGCATALVTASLEAWSFVAMDQAAGNLYDEKEMAPELPTSGYPFDPAELLVLTKANLPKGENEYAPLKFDFEKYFKEKWEKGEYGTPEG